MAVAGCGLKCLKYSLFVFNLVFWVIGCAILGVGIWFLVDSKRILEYLNLSSAATSYGTLVTVAGAVVVTIGAITMIAGFLGCCGAIRESQCMLSLFFAILFLLFAALVSFGVIAIVKNDWIQEGVRVVLKTEYDNKSSNGLTQYLWDNYKCCGYLVESTCSNTVTYPTGSTCTVGSTTCGTNNCVDAMWKNMIQPYQLGIGIGLIVAGVIMLFGMVFSMCLCCGIRD